MELTTQSADNPLPLGKIRVFVFNDNAWTNGAPDTEEAGLGGFQVGLEEQTGQRGHGRLQQQPALRRYLQDVERPGDARLRRDQQPRSGDVFHRRAPAARADCNGDPDSRWYQTTTIDGGLQLHGADRRGRRRHRCAGRAAVGAPEHPHRLLVRLRVLAARRSQHQRAPARSPARRATGWSGPPYTTGTFTDPVENPFVALSRRLDRPDRLRRPGRREPATSTSRTSRPATTTWPIWDEQLSYIMRFKPVTVAAGRDRRRQRRPDDDGSVGLGVSRWFGWLDGNGLQGPERQRAVDDGVEPPIANTDMDQRWRDGSIKEATFTDPNGDYVYPTAEGGALGRWIINEQGFARFSAVPGRRPCTTSTPAP